MKNLILKVMVISLTLNSLLFSQRADDSLYIDRPCNIILFNGFEAEGKITFRNNDSVFLKTELIELKIPVKDIRLVTEPGVTLQHILAREDEERLDAFIAELRLQKMKREKIVKSIPYDTSELCDVYFEDHRRMSNVNMIALNDSLLEIIQDTNVQNVSYYDIRKIVFRSKKINGLYGGLIGGMSSFMFSLLLFSNAYDREKGHSWDFFLSSIAAIPGFLIGSGLGLVTSEGECYNFESGESTGKNKKIKFIINKHHK